MTAATTYEAVFGLEIYVQIKTDPKMICGGKGGSLLGAILIVLLVGISPLWAQNSGNDPFFTSALPEPDRAEIYTIPMPHHAYRRQVFLTGDGARNLAALVRAQKFGVASDVGDLPHYGLRFYRNGKLIADETICFACERLTPKASDLHAVTASETFDAHTPQALQLESYIDKALPLDTK